MRALTLMTVASALLLTGVAHAVPLNLPLQGVIRDNAGVPVVEDVFQVTFSLYDAVLPLARTALMVTGIRTMSFTIVVDTISKSEEY